MKRVASHARVTFWQRPREQLQVIVNTIKIRDITTSKRLERQQISI
jgi:hypothetical protein